MSGRHFGQDRSDDPGFVGRQLVGYVMVWGGEENLPTHILSSLTRRDRKYGHTEKLESGQLQLRTARKNTPYSYQRVIAIQNTRSPFTTRLSVANIRRLQLQHWHVGHQKLKVKYTDGALKLSTHIW